MWAERAEKYACLIEGCRRGAQTRKLLCAEEQAERRVNGQLEVGACTVQVHAGRLEGRKTGRYNEQRGREESAKCYKAAATWKQVGGTATNRVVHTSAAAHAWKDASN